ncbi:MAG: hypothetical protein R2849_10955 [Thermomicrobiales bacterium]
MAQNRRCRQIFWRRFRRHKLAMVSAAYLILLILVAVFAPIVAPHDPYKNDLQLARFGEPAAPSLSHPFGSDQLGRDQLSRIIYGARVSLMVGFVATGLAIVAGTLLEPWQAMPGSGSTWASCASPTSSLAFPPLLFAMPRWRRSTATSAGDPHRCRARHHRLMNVASATGRRVPTSEPGVHRKQPAVGASGISIARELLPNAVGQSPRRSASWQLS